MLYSKRNTGKKSPFRRFYPALHALEARCLPATFTVANLDDFGSGSFRQALLDANLQPGPDVIDFTVTGTLNLLQDLPQITDTVDISALSAGVPSFGVNASGNGGLVFAGGSKGSSLSGLAIFGASGSGVVLNDSQIHLYSNYIGLTLNGTPAEANAGDGITIHLSSNDNLIGNSDPLKQISYFDASGVTTPVSGWQGIRAGDVPKEFLITGTSGSSGLLYRGPIEGVGGTSFLVNYPGATSTSLYGVDNQGKGKIQLVGSFRNGDGVVHGFLYQGTVEGLANPSGYRQIDYSGAKYNHIHSVAEDLMVGNADGPEGDLPAGSAQAILYSTSTGLPVANIVYPGSLSNTAYGIWSNGNDSYTIAGGFSLPGEPVNGISHGYLVDYNSSTGEFTHWKQIDYQPPGFNVDMATHIQGISSVEAGVYTLAVNAVVAGSDQSQGAWGTVRRTADGSFGVVEFKELQYSGLDPATHSTRADSVYGNQVVGVVIGQGGVTPYQSKLDFEFQLSNVISNNMGNGIGVYGSSRNQISMNYIGTDLAGAKALTNGMNGIFLTQGASDNIIGGQATGGNDPTGDVFVRPPMGNLISGNTLNGVLINDASTGNLLSGNYIGTDTTGNLAIGNTLDGVAIENANKNKLIGCLVNQDPFVFYNVISGNGGNGLRVKNSNDVIVHANFFGAGANNAVMVPNGLNGILVEGTSANTQVGGVIPLGNVSAGNGLNGIEVRDQVTGFVSFNTFGGLFAFGGAAPNGKDGILITSTGGNNLLETNVFSGNVENGIHLSGDANGVTIDPNIVGLVTDGSDYLPNGKNGVLIDGNAHLNVLGGNIQSVIPRNIFSGNTEAGLSFQGTAHDNIVFNTAIGLNSTGDATLGNGGPGIVMGPGTFRNIIGGADPQFPNFIGGNQSDGILIDGSDNNIIRNNIIGQGLHLPVATNGGSGVHIVNGSGNQIGQNGLPNTIVYQLSGGIQIDAGSKNQIIGNSIDSNLFGGISIAQGANNDQPTPELLEAFAPNPSTLTLKGKINASPNSTYLIQLYGNSQVLGFAEGKTFLGSVEVTTDALGEGLFTYTQAFNAAQGVVYTATATDSVGNSSEFSLGLLLANSQIYAVGAGQGGAPLINIYDAVTNQLVSTILAYDAGFTGGVRVSVGDLTGDGIPEIVATPGPGGGPNVRVFDSLTGELLSSFMAFSSGFTGGVFSSVGDVDGDGLGEIIVGAGAGGGPNVRVFSGSNSSLLSSFFAFDAGFTGGVSVATGDLDSNGQDDIIVGAGAGGGPNVRTFHGSTNALMSSFFAFDPGFTGGVFVASGDVDGDGITEVIVGAGAGGGPEVGIFQGDTRIGTFNAYDTGFTGGVRVGVVSAPNTGITNIVTGPGQGGGPEVRVFDGETYEKVDDYFAFDQDFLGGLFVGGFDLMDPLPI